MEENTLVEFEIQDRIGYITLNRPDKRNALNFQMVIELRKAFHAAAQNGNVKVIVLRANGKAFCAGADLDALKQLQKNTLEDNLKDSNNLMEFFLSIYRSSKVVIAQVEGHAIAGGAGLVSVCDFAFSVPKAKFGYTEVRIGFVPAIVMSFLIRKCGELRAKELLLSGEIIDAETAANYNMINKVVPAEEIKDHVKDFAQALCNKNSSASMQLTKKMIADIQTMPIVDALRFASKMNAHARGTEDCQKGIAAFLNKETLEW